MKYPEYINGVKQVQNPIYRLIIRVWYSEWFRGCILFGIPHVPVLIYLACKYNWNSDLGEAIVLGSYLMFFALGLAINDWSNLRRIGLTEYHEKIQER